MISRVARLSDEPAMATVVDEPAMAVAIDEPAVAISIPTVARVLATATTLVASLGLIAELAYYLARIDSELVPTFSLSYEHNAPTWYASSLLLVCALLLGVIALVTRQRQRPGVGHWLGLAVGFWYISLDETVGIHERASGWFDTGGVLYFGWVIPGAIIVALIGALYLSFLARLHPRTRARFVIAGALYVTGALLFELPLGYWTEQAGDDNLTYALIDWVEESLELTGITLFAVALLGHLASRPQGERDAEPHDEPGDHLYVILAHRPDEPVVPEMHDGDGQGDADDRPVAVVREVGEDPVSESQDE